MLLISAQKDKHRKVTGACMPVFLMVIFSGIEWCRFLADLIFSLISNLNLKSVFTNTFSCAGLCFCLVLLPVKACLAAATVNQLKVVYLYQFTQFIEWPASAFSSTDSNFQVCVLGTSAVNNSLALLKGRHHGSHPIIIRYPSTVQEVEGCHLLYMSLSGSHYEAEIFKQFKNSALLTVSSQPRFIERGGVIGFKVIDERLRLNINRGAALNANIKLSAKLMEVAVSIIESPAHETSR